MNKVFKTYQWDVKYSIEGHRRIQSFYRKTDAMDFVKMVKAMEGVQFLIEKRPDQRSNNFI